MHHQQSAATSSGTAKVLRPAVVVALVAAVLVRLLFGVVGGLMVYDLLRPVGSGDGSRLPADDPSIVLPTQSRPIVDRSLTAAGYRCLTELVEPVTVIGCYRSNDNLWVDLRYRIKAGAIVGFTLHGGSSDNGDAAEFETQAKIISRIALRPKTTAEVMQGVGRAVARNGQVRVDTHSTKGWSGTASNDADHWSNEFTLSMSSLADHDSTYVIPVRMAGGPKHAKRILTDLGYDCTTTGALRECDDPTGPLSDWGGTITIVNSRHTISRLTAEWDNLEVLTDFITVLKDADPPDAKLLTTAVIRGNDGHAHHLVINGLMIASEPGMVSVYGIDWED